MRNKSYSLLLFARLVAAIFSFCIAQSAFAGSILGWGSQVVDSAQLAKKNHIAISAGYWHSLAIRSDGTIVGWGSNGPGQATPPPGNNYIAISAGGEHSLALRSDGTIVGWGNNYYGQRTLPPGNNFIAIAAGGSWDGGHSLALKSDGSIVGWGYNGYGQASPPAGNNFIAIAAGWYHSLALRSDGSIVGWGDNGSGRATPPAGNNFIAIAAGGEHSLALRSDGSIVGWGDNEYGQATLPPENNYIAISAGGHYSLALRSDGTIVGWGYNVYGQATPPTGNNYIAVSAGAAHSLALRSDGTIVGWGWNEYGQATPPTGNNFIAISAGGNHSLALRSDGSIVGWGWNGSGQATPPTGDNYIAISAGGNHSLALRSDGTIVGWGWNDYGQATPPAGNNFIAIAAGGYHSLALRSDGSIVGWGYNWSGQATPPTGNNYIAIAAGRWHSLALRSDGSIVGWGNNYYGQATPPTGNNYIAISAGGLHSLALRSDGTIVGWGNNGYGQATPPPENNYIAISTGGEHSLALRSDGTIVGWGYNKYGRATPPTGNNYIAIAAGVSHSLAIVDSYLPPLPDLIITDIKPIQTIQDIPLIKDKATMVRVFVDLSPSDIEELPDVTVELQFEGNKYYETATLIRYDGKLYVVPDKHLSNFKKWKSANKSFMIRTMLFDYGLDAFNFEGPDKPWYPLYPKTVAETTIIATVDPYNIIGESVETNNEKPASFKVKSFPKDSYKVYFQRWSRNGNPSDFTQVNNEESFKNFTKSQFDYLIATYPIPEGMAKYNPSSSIMSGRSTYAALLGACSVFKKDFDRVVLVVPKMIGGFVGLKLPLVKSCVFVDETAPQQITAHEIAHTYGYIDDWKVLWLYPGEYPCGSFAGDGWDVRGKASSPTREDKRAKIKTNLEHVSDCTFNWHSFMSDTAQNPWAPSNNYWFNKYNIFLEKIIGTSDPRVLVVSGIIYEDNAVDLLPFYSYDGFPDDLDPGNYSFECLSSTEEVLSNVSFEAVFYYDQELGQNVSPFAFTIPYPDNTAKVILKHHDTILKEVIVSQSPPTVNILSINYLGNETYQVSWNANDGDGDDLTYSMFYSHNGQDWFPFVFSSNELIFNYVLDTSELPGSDSSLVKIVITDGINTAEAVSNPFSVSNKPPSAFISRPLNDSVFTRGQDIVFAGWAYDPEEFELDGSSFVWTSNIDGVIGSGASFTTSNLSVGTHSITLNVSDANGLSDLKVCTITVLLPGDFNIDYRVDLIDLAKFSSKWLNTCSNPNWCEGTDLDHSGLVDFIDFSMFAYKWLWTKIVADFDIDDDVDFADYAVLANRWRAGNCAESAWCDGADLNKSGSVDLYDLAEFAEHWLEGK